MPRRHRLWGTIVVPAALITLAACSSSSAAGTASPAASSSSKPTGPDPQISAMHPPAAFTTRGGFSVPSLYPAQDVTAGSYNPYDRTNQTWAVTDAGIASLGTARNSPLQVTYTDLSGHRQWSGAVPPVHRAAGDTTPASSVRLVEEGGQQWIAVLQTGLSDPDPTAVSPPEPIVRIDTFSMTTGQPGAHVDVPVLDSGVSPVTTPPGSRTLLVTVAHAPDSTAMLLSPSTGQMAPVPPLVQTVDGTPNRAEALDQVAGTTLYDTSCAGGGGGNGCPSLGPATVGPHQAWVWDGRYGLAYTANPTPGPFQILDGAHQRTVTVPWTCGDSQGYPNQQPDRLVVSASGRYLTLDTVGVDITAGQMVCDPTSAAAIVTAVSDTGTAYADLSGGVSGVAELDLTNSAAKLQRVPGVDALPLAVTADGHGVFASGTGMSGQVIVLPPAR